MPVRGTQDVLCVSCSSCHRRSRSSALTWVIWPRPAPCTASGCASWRRSSSGRETARRRTSSACRRSWTGTKTASPSHRFEPRSTHTQVAAPRLRAAQAGVSSGRLASKRHISLTRVCVCVCVCVTAVAGRFLRHCQFAVVRVLRSRLP